MKQLQQHAEIAGQMSRPMLQRELMLQHADMSNSGMKSWYGSFK